MNNKEKLLVIALLLSFFLLTCKKEESTPLYVGKWAFDEAVPPENVDECYNDTWFWIYDDKRFQIYDSCENETTVGEWVRKGFEIQVIVDGEVFENFRGKILNLDNNFMIIETDMFDSTTKIRFIKVHDATGYQTNINKHE